MSDEIRQSVLAFLIDKESGKVLLYRRSAPPAWNGLWNGVAGTVAAGEKPEEAMVRKVEEETGLKVAPGDLDLRGVLHTEQGVVFVFRGYANVFAARDNAKDGEARIIYPLNAHWEREPVIPNLKWLLPLVFSSSVKGVTQIDC